MLSMPRLPWPISLTDQPVRPKIRSSPEREIQKMEKLQSDARKRLETCQAAD
jgi:hypothetical protein